MCVPSRMPCTCKQHTPAPPGLASGKDNASACACLCVCLCFACVCVCVCVCHPQALRERLLGEAEAIRAVVSCLEALPPLTHTTQTLTGVGLATGGAGLVRVEVRVGHRALLDALTTTLQLPKQQCDQVRVGI